MTEFIYLLLHYYEGLLSTSCYTILKDYYLPDIVIPSRDLNLGPKHSLLEYETWRLRPLGHHGRFNSPTHCITYLINDPLTCSLFTYGFIQW